VSSFGDSVVRELLRDKLTLRCDGGFRLDLNSGFRNCDRDGFPIEEIFNFPDTC